MSTIRTNTLLHSDGSTTTQPSIPALDQRMAKAWVNFNGTGTVAIRDSYNISSITDNSTGNYTANFTAAMANTDYAVMFTAQHASGVSWLDVQGIGSLTASAFTMVNREGSSMYDCYGQHAVVFA